MLLYFYKVNERRVGIFARNSPKVLKNIKYLQIFRKSFGALEYY